MTEEENALGNRKEKKTVNNLPSISFEICDRMYFNTRLMTQSNFCGINNC